MPTEPSALTPEPTDMPLPTPTDMPASTPEPTQGISPTDMPMPTDMPEATQTPEPTPSPTPEPTLTPEPSKVPIMAPEATKAPVGEDTIKIGDYEIPAVRQYNGKELPWFYEDEEVLRAEKVGENVYLAIVDAEKRNGNHVTETHVLDIATGKVTSSNINLEYYGVDFKTAAVTDILGVLALKGGKEYLEKLGVSPSLMPTPTPTPTPFPTPNPEKPKMLASYKGDKEYGDITVEAWDNGYLYVKGTGVYRKKASMSYTPQDLKDYWEIGRISGVKVTHVVVEKGITELRDFPSWANNSYDKRESIICLEFPSTLTGVRSESFDINFLHDVEIIGYKNEEKITYLLETDGNIVSDKESLYDVLRENFNVHSVKYSD